MNFGNMDDCAEYVRATIVPRLQRIPGLQTVYLRGTNFHWLTLKKLKGTKIQCSSEYLLWSYQMKMKVLVNFECYSPLIHGKFLNGDLQNRNFRFCWTLDDMVQRITEFHNHKN